MWVELSLFAGTALGLLARLFEILVTPETPLDPDHLGAFSDLLYWFPLVYVLAFLIFESRRRLLAISLYDPTSSIRVRILQYREPATINADWFQNKLTIAARLRTTSDEKNTTGYRLVHGENDGLPGLVLDRYADTLVLKLYTPAWIPHLKNFCDALAQVSPASYLILRLNRSLPVHSPPA